MPSWTPPLSTRKSSFTSMAPLLEHARREGKATSYGTEFVRGVEGARSSSSSGKSQLVGLGAGPVFLGGSLMSFGAGLAAFSVHHRYQRYTQLSGQEIENPSEPCEIEAACPRNSLCQWGVCHCLPGFIQAWGACLPQREPDFEYSSSPIRVEGTECRISDECQTSDINLVCKGGVQKQCKCRNPTRWNSNARECQIFIEADCSHLSRDSPLPEVLRLAAATASIIRRGYGAEFDDRSELESLGISGPLVEHLLGVNRGRFTSLHAPFSTPDDLPIPLDRTESPEEALNYSLLTFLPTNISKPDLLEALCRDLEAFSDTFQLEDFHQRPRGCSPIARPHCAVLFDSSTCSTGSWRLEVGDGDQRQLGYFSSDWRFRFRL